MNMSSWMTAHTVAFQDVTASVYGDPVFLATTTVKARSEPGTKLLISAGGNQAMATTRLVSEVLLPVGTRVWIPGDSAPKRVLATSGAAVKGGGYALYESWL